MSKRIPDFSEFSPEHRKRIFDGVKEMMYAQQKINHFRDQLNDVKKTISDEFEIDGKVLAQAMQSLLRHDYEQREKLHEAVGYIVEEIGHDEE